MRKLLLFAFLMAGISLNAQILNDSTVQFVGYWNLNESQTYRVEFSKFKIAGQDTTSKDVIRYDSEVTIIDSTATGYKIKWVYKNYSFKTDNELTARLLRLGENIPFVYTTDELGAFKELINYGEIKASIGIALDSLAVEFSDIPNINRILDQVKETYATKEAIENNGMDEILYFHYPFGAQYNVNRVYSTDTKLSNLYGGDPFDAVVESSIVELDTVNSTSVVKIFTTIDSEQATDATYEYLKKLAQTNNEPEPERTGMPPLSIRIRFASNVHMPTGWVIYAVNVKEVKSGDNGEIERTQMELK